MTKQEVKNKNGLKYNPAIFSDRELAFSFAHGSVKPHRVILGENGKYWVVCPADAERLQKAGYEYAK